MRVGDLVRHRDQMELEAMVILKGPMNAYVLAGYQEQGCVHLSLMHLRRHYRASWTCLLCRLSWLKPIRQLSTTQPLVYSLPGGMGERIRRVKVRKLVR